MTIYKFPRRTYSGCYVHGVNPLTPRGVENLWYEYIYQRPGPGGASSYYIHRYCASTAPKEVGDDCIELMVSKFISFVKGSKDET
jgi:hypothetical protein